MKIKISFILLITLISTMLFGCQSADNTTIKSGTNTSEHEVETIQQSEEISKELKLDGEIKKFIISNLQQKGSSVFDDSQSIETITRLFSNALKQNGLVDMADPEFKMEIVFANENEQSFYLWIGEKGERSTLMETNDTHTIYTVSEDMTEKLIDLVNRIGMVE